MPEAIEIDTDRLRETIDAETERSGGRLLCILALTTAILTALNLCAPLGRTAGLGVSAIGAVFLPQTDYVCSVAGGSPCDLRALARFVAVTAWGEAGVSRGEWKYYARAGAGPWWGGDVDASPGQSTRERGGLVTLEIGSRDGRLDVGIEQKRLEGTRFGMIPLMNVVVRLSF